VTRRGILLVEVGGMGGVSDYTEGLATELAGQGRKIVLVTARDHRMRLPPEVEVLALVPWLRGRSAAGALLRRARLGPLVNALGFLALLPRLAMLARRSALVHFQGEYFLPLTALFALVVRATGTPLVHTAHGTFDRRGGHPLARRVLAACAAATIVHTHADVERLPPAARRRSTVIPHGDYGFVARRGGSPQPAAARAALGVPAGGLVVLLAGQLRPDKGIADLLAAARGVPAAHVLICGEERGGLAAAQQLLADPALAGRVTVREGFQDDVGLARALAAADVVALPYATAGASGVLLLAYGAGRPVVAYPVGGLVEAVLDGETGWLCARPDPAALAATLEVIVAAGREECGRRGAAGERFARQRFSWAPIAEATGAVYERVAQPLRKERTSAE
jgi:glycosyltransferase involved in cell wall biosynthesis